MTFRPYPVMTVLTLISLGILIWLGNWQYGRFIQKMEIDRQTPDWTVLDGDIVPDSEVLSYYYVEGQSGWMRVVAVDTGDAIVYTPIEIVQQIDPPAVCDGEHCPTGRLSARGIYKPAFKRNAFTAADDLENRVFYVLDPAEFGQLLPDETEGRVTPDMFEPEVIRFVSESGSYLIDNPYARLRLDDELPPQRHFGYAITWWGLAMALIGVYLAFHHQKGRLRFRNEGKS
ncbi:SURF1 family cytochrome oxidase biogenesis protein [uncultured Hyphomonas sp.]|uniref:SURF1 family cytochrome oxidase biogenesis protein n=1 Tax=uncultured Hyphomonas sp. TaxID=225298 RepID=UPI002AAC1E83|nr:SURF1 family cytochrome oxidase biogenesis protein [uncultured Hyphomonas sp.]